MSRLRLRFLATFFGLACLLIRYPAGDGRMICGFPLPMYEIQNGNMRGGGQAVLFAPVNFLIGWCVGLFVLWGISTLIGKGRQTGGAEPGQEQPGDSE